MNRRDFMKSAFVASLAGAFAPVAKADEGTAAVSGKAHPLVGKKLPAWKPGEFQVHFIYTGVAESMFWILPDGTTMLLDCGCHEAIQRGHLAVHVLPNGRRHASEWIARYVERVNPAKTSVDYMMLSHYHSDHSGNDKWGEGRFAWGRHSICRSGFAQAAETLKFGKAFDRGWPTFDEPIPCVRCGQDSLEHVQKTYEWLQRRDGLKIEKFKVGAVNQVAMLKNAAAYPDFKITNICANGKILTRDGGIRDLYAEFHNARSLNENAMSLGMIVQYGPFRFFTAGDFSDSPRLPDGSRRNIENELGKELDPVDVAKINHHGHHAMPAGLVGALQARVWTACIWDQLHCTADTMAVLGDRNVYPGDRLIAPGMFPAERREEDAKASWLADVAPESFTGCHVVVTVPPKATTYTVACVNARDEQMMVTGAYELKVKG